MLTGNKETLDKNCMFHSPYVACFFFVYSLSMLSIRNDCNPGKKSGKKLISSDQSWGISIQILILHILAGKQREINLKIVPNGNSANTL